MDEPFPDGLATLALTERELFSLYVQYPEIDFDPEYTEKMAEPLEHFSSPASKTGERDELDSVQMSNSTTHTTPLRYDLFGPGTSSGDEYSIFCSALRECDLPTQTVQYFQSLGSRIVQLGTCLVAEDSLRPDSKRKDTVTDLSAILLPQLQHSIRKCKEQIDTFTFVTDLAPFSIVPTDIALWSNYRQRATLISKHLSCPSQSELKLLEHLTQLFDAYVYHPFLHLIRSPQRQINNNIKCSIYALYDSLLTLLGTYQRWICTMGEFRRAHMTPIMRRIQDSPWIQREIEQTELTLEAARAVLSRDNREAAGLVLQADQIDGARKLAEQRAKSSGQPFKGGGRYRREYTV